MSIFALLPSEIIDIILWEYWYDQSKFLIHQHIKNPINTYNKILNYVNKYLFFGFSNTSIKSVEQQLLSNLREFNNQLKNIENTRASRIIIVHRFPIMEHCFSNNYLHGMVFNNIHDNFKYIAAFCMIHCHPESRYVIHYKFKDFIA